MAAPLRPEDLDGDDERVSLCELLDRVLHKGVVVRGDLVISVADVDLLYLGVGLILASTETARKAGLVLPHDMARTRRAAGLLPPEDGAPAALSDAAGRRRG